MARLRTLKPLVREMSPKLRTQSVDFDQGRRQIEWRKWYNLARWKRLRWQTLVRDLFTCQMCNRIEGDTSLLVCDHKEPHRGDPDLFWDPENLQCLCKPCHDKDKQRAEQGQR
jgi:5-methylcytosine-specific restriction endonuclease McrA